MNLSQRDGGLPPDSVVQDEDTILADSERVVARYHQAGDGAMVQIALAPCSPFSVTTSLMRSTAPAGAAAQRAAAHPSRRDRGREPLLPADPQLPAARLSGGLRLAQRSGLARPRHPFRRRRDQAHGARRHHHLALRRAAIRRWRRALARSARWNKPECVSASASTARPRMTPRI